MIIEGTDGQYYCPDYGNDIFKFDVDEVYLTFPASHRKIWELDGFKIRLVAFHGRSKLLGKPASVWSFVPMSKWPFGGTVQNNFNRCFRFTQIPKERLEELAKGAQPTVFELGFFGLSILEKDKIIFKIQKLL